RARPAEADVDVVAVRLGLGDLRVAARRVEARTAAQRGPDLTPPDDLLDADPARERVAVPAPVAAQQQRHDLVALAALGLHVGVELPVQCPALRVQAPRARALDLAAVPDPPALADEAALEPALEPEQAWLGRLRAARRAVIGVVVDRVAD